jgi:hypothetical protein
MRTEGQQLHAICSFLSFVQRTCNFVSRNLFPWFASVYCDGTFLNIRNLMYNREDRSVSFSPFRPQFCLLPYD